MKLKKNYLFNYLIIMWLISPTTSYAVGARVTELTLTGDYKMEGPADRVPFAQIIRNTGSNGVYFCNQTDQDYDLGAIYMTPIVPYLNQTYNQGPSYSTQYLYSIGDPGFAVVPWYSGSNWRGGDFQTGLSPQSIPPQRTLAWKGYLPNASRKGIAGSDSGGGVRNFAGAYIWKAAGRPTQDLVWPDQLLYRYECVDTAGVVRQYEDIRLNAGRIPVKVTSCAPAASSVIVNLDPIPIETIKNASNDTLFNTKSQTFGLICDAGITLKMRVFDINHPGNLTTTAKLSSDSTATGVGFGVTNSSGTRLQMSTDSSTAPATGTTDATQYLLDYTTTNNQHVTHMLNFGYVRDTDAGEVKSGTAKTSIGITYSYQ